METLSLHLTKPNQSDEPDDTQHPSYHRPFLTPVSWGPDSSRLPSTKPCITILMDPSSTAVQGLLNKAHLETDRWKCPTQKAERYITSPPTIGSQKEKGMNS